MSRILGFALTLALSGALLPAQAGAQQAQPCSDSLHRAFDFWIGEWEVHQPDGSLAGHNTIRRMSRGCGLAESWRGTSGSRGRSLNFVDRADGRWHQIWVDNGGGVLRLSGGPTEEGMRLTGTASGDTTRLHRITWTPNEEGQVRQHWQVSTDDGATWSTLFDGLYSRIPTAGSLDTGGACDTPQGRAFDFWAGEWRVDSRQRGPDGEWVETRGVWRAEEVMDGCGFVDETAGDYGGGPMSGVGTRIYDPQADRWTLTWTSTQAPGRLGTWEGRFDEDGVGEFFQEQDTPQGTVRTRIRWMDVQESSADWDYSVSRDGGETWQVMWEMELQRLAESGGS